MITLLTGKKGSGKTKKLIELVHAAVEKSNGNVVCVEKGDTLTYDVDHSARLVNIVDYNIVGFEGLYGFICGLCAGNYDITDILVDSTLKIGGFDLNALEAFLIKVEPLTKASNVNITFSISADSTDFPEGIKKVDGIEIK